MPRGYCGVYVIDHEKTVFFICGLCKKVLTEGRYTILITTKEIKFPHRQRQYMLGVNTPVSCCGHAVEVLALFNSEAEANARVREVTIYLNENNTIKELKLFEIPQLHEVTV